MTSEGAVRRTFISAAKPHNKAACSLSVKWLSYWSSPCRNPSNLLLSNPCAGFSYFVLERTPRCLSPLFSLFFTPNSISQSVSFTRMLWQLLKDSHARAIQTLHAFKTQWQQAPTGVPQRRISSRTFGIVAAASSAPGCARQPALNSSGHLQAPWYCTVTLQQPARLQRLPPGRGCAGVKGAL